MLEMTFINKICLQGDDDELGDVNLNPTDLVKLLRHFTDDFRMLHVGVHVGRDLTTTPGALNEELDELQQRSIAVNLVALNPVIHHSLKANSHGDEPRSAGSISLVHPTPIWTLQPHTQPSFGHFTCTPNHKLDSSPAHPTPIWTVHLHTQTQFGHFTCTPNLNLGSSPAHPTPIWTVHLHNQPQFRQFTCTPNPHLDVSPAHPTPIWMYHLHTQPNLDISPAHPTPI